MQCFESEVTRNFLFALCCELNPCLERDDVLLEDVLDSHGIGSVAALFAMGEDDLQAMVCDLVEELPVAA